MKKFFSFFSGNQTENDKKNIKDEEQIIDLKLYSTSNFKGINPYILSILYFMSDEEKNIFLDEYFRIMAECGVNEDTSNMYFHEAISKYELKENVWLQFYRMITDFDFFHVSEKKGVITKNIQNGIKIVQSYDDLIDSNLGLHIANFNIKNKLLSKINDISFEEKLILDTLEREMEHDYERLDNYMFLSFTYDELNNKEKFDFYMNKIEFGCQAFRMSERIIGQRLKEIGEYFLARNDVENTLKWFELGSKIYPKLAVKRKIVELKAQLLNNKD